MAWYRRYKSTSARRVNKTARRGTWGAKKVARGYAASPAGKHRRLAMLLWGIAKKARAIGNRRHASAMTNLGKRALALSKAEYRMWKKGQSLRKRSLAANRALKAW